MKPRSPRWEAVKPAAWQIRQVGRVDFDALYRLDQKCFARGIAYTRSDLRSFLSQLRNIALLAENAAGKLFGFIIAEWDWDEKGVIGHIVTIDVDPEATRSGVGRALMRAAEADLRKHRVELVRLEVAVDNLAAQAFYERENYRGIGRIRGYYLGRIDALVMEKRLPANAEPGPATPPASPE